MAGSLHSLRYEKFCRACPAEAREASEGWWSQAGSNRRPLACHASALPAELWPHSGDWTQSSSGRFVRIRPSGASGRRAGKSGTTVDHTSARSSSLLIAADVADDVGDVLVTLFLIGNEGRIVVVIVLKRLVDLDIVLRF